MFFKGIKFDQFCGYFAGFYNFTPENESVNNSYNMSVKMDITVSLSLISFLEWHIHFFLTYLSKKPTKNKGESRWGHGFVVKNISLFVCFLNIAKDHNTLKQRATMEMEGCPCVNHR